LIRLDVTVIDGRGKVVSVSENEVEIFENGESEDR
jgi:hypothetical protein